MPASPEPESETARTSASGSGPGGASKDASSPAYSPHAIHMVRTVALTNLQLSQMADQKASILLGAAFVVFSIVVGQSSGGHLSPSLAILAFSAFVSALLAAMAVVPSIKPAEVQDKRKNILFFGAFTQLSEQDFSDNVLELLQKDEDIYRTMLRDIYYNGQVLQNKKYRYLIFAYRAFLTGLILTCLVFMLERAGMIGSIG